MRYDKEFPLITSLVPALSRLGSGQEQIGPVYQKYCVDSWLRAGFTVYSLNTAAEIERLRPVYLDVHFIEAPRDAAAVVGRPLVFIADMVTALRDRGYDQCGIVNSDLSLAPTPGLMEFLAAEIPGSCVFGHRIDVQRVGDRTGAPYRGGYDFFFLETATFDDKAFAPFVQGIPWWDYGLPLMQAMQGIGLKRLDTPLFHHLLHEQRWDLKGWREFYLIMRRMLMDVAAAQMKTSGLDTVPGAQALRYMMGEGEFIANHFSLAGNLGENTEHHYLFSFVLYCQDLISLMSAPVRLPSDAETRSPAVPDGARRPATFPAVEGA